MKRIALMVSGVLLLQGMAISLQADGEKEQTSSDDLYTNTYRVPWEFFLSPASPGGSVDPFAAPGDEGGGTGLSKVLSAREVLEKAGVTFGEGASAKSVVKRGKQGLLIVRNTQDQMELVEAYIQGGCHMVENQMTIIVEHIEVDANWLSQWLLDHRLDRDGTPLREDVQKLVRAKQAQVIETSAVLARSGQRARTESISEYLVASSGDPPEISNKVKLSGGAEAPKTSFAPTSYVRKNLGIVLEVDPVVGADGMTIDLNLAPPRVARVGETKWPQE